MSEYLPAMETVGHLGFDEARWFTECYLREREWGAFDLLSRLGCVGSVGQAPRQSLPTHPPLRF
jgi:hypothetical protein